MTKRYRDKEILRLRKEGKKQGEIARMLDCPRVLVIEILRRNGIK